FHAVIYIFGLFLLFTGVRLVFQKAKQINPEKNWLIRLCRRVFPVTPDYVNDFFFVRKENRFFVTPLFLVLLAIETTDIIFAIDSIPAILAITRDPFIVYTSNIFAILGLRNLFFLLEGSLRIFSYLHYGISAILIFVGLKMLFSDVIKISPFIALGIVFAILFISILASLLLQKKNKI